MSHVEAVGGWAPGALLRPLSGRARWAIHRSPERALCGALRGRSPLVRSRRGDSPRAPPPPPPRGEAVPADGGVKDALRGDLRPALVPAPCWLRASDALPCSASASFAISLLVICTPIARPGRQRRPRSLWSSGEQ